MVGLSAITWSLIHLTVWVVCLAVLIPVSMILWMMLKDVFTNDGNKLKETMGSLHAKVGGMVQTQTNKEAERLPVKYADDLNEEKIVNESVDVEPDTSIEEIIEKPLIQDEAWNPVEKEGVKEETSGIIYLDRKTSLTSDFPVEAEILPSPKVE